METIPAGNHISVFQTTKQTPLFLNTVFILYMTQYIPFIPGYQYPLYNLHKKPCANMVVLTKIKFLYSFYFRYSGGKTIEKHQSPEYKRGGDTGPQRPLPRRLDTDIYPSCGRVFYLTYLSIFFTYLFRSFASLFPVLHDDSFPGIRPQFPTVLP